MKRAEQLQDLSREHHGSLVMAKRIAEIAESGEASLDQKINCYKEIAKYTYPRLKSQDLRFTSPEDNSPTIIELIAKKT